MYPPRISKGAMQIFILGATKSERNLANLLQARLRESRSFVVYEAGSWAQTQFLNTAALLPDKDSLEFKEALTVYTLTALRGGAVA